MDYPHPGYPVPYIGKLRAATGMQFNALQIRVLEGFHTYGMPLLSSFLPI